MSTRYSLDGGVTAKRCYPTAADACDALLSARIAAALRDTCQLPPGTAPLRLSALAGTGTCPAPLPGP